MVEVTTKARDAIRYPGSSHFHRVTMQFAGPLLKANADRLRAATALTDGVQLQISRDRKSAYLAIVLMRPQGRETVEALLEVWRANWRRLAEEELAPLREADDKTALHRARVRIRRGSPKFTHGHETDILWTTKQPDLSVEQESRNNSSSGSVEAVSPSPLASESIDDARGPERPGGVDVHEVLGRVALLNKQIDELKEQLDQTVEQARSAGASWRQIGDAVGIRSDSAFRRWDTAAKAKHAAYQRERSSAAYTGSSDS